MRLSLLHIVREFGDRRFRRRVRGGKDRAGTHRGAAWRPVYSSVSIPLFLFWLGLCVHVCQRALVRARAARCGMTLHWEGAPTCGTAGQLHVI